MYTTLARWWPLISPPEDYEEEAGLYAKAIEKTALRPVRQVLELGSGGGNNASHLKRRYRMTLVDLSPDMLAQSRGLNPECEHVEADMRTVRLDRDFDAVFLHDAVMYMATEEDLAAAIETAAVHARPGGVALFVPDDTAETFRPKVDSFGHDGDGRSIRYTQVEHEPEGTAFRVTFTYTMREEGDELVEEEDHIFGLFPRDTWLELIARAGLEAIALPYSHSTFRAEASDHEMFAGRNRREGSRAR
jgi:SAM-dependent methyltransferase